MKYALIGCGRIAINHIKAVIKNQLEFVAVCDTVAENMTALLQKGGLELPQKAASTQRSPYTA